MKSKSNTFLYALLYPVHIITIISTIICYLTVGFNWIYLLYFFLGWVVVYGIGVHVVLHRLVSHNAFEPRSFLRPILLWLSCLSLQGSPIGWAAIHRGSHHSNTDTDQDAHSPSRGKWYSWHMWLYDWHKYFKARYVTDLLRDPLQIWFSKNYTKIVLISYLIIGIISWQLLLFGFMLPAVLGLYMENTGNVLYHSGKLGYRNFEISDKSRNITLLAWLTWGMGYHNNHHAQPRSYDFGTTISGYLHEFDTSLIFLPLIATKSSRDKIHQARQDKL
jgi:stearoyl-CoA desaturase (delta-9 desaturase)